MPLPDVDVGAETDEDLLVYMAWREDHPAMADAACTEFYQRHLRYVYAVILRAYGRELGEHGVEDMVTETFVRVFERAETYQPCGSADVDRQRKNVLAWVGTIATNLCRDCFRRPDAQLVLVDDWDEDSRVAAPNAEPPPLHSDQLQCVHEAMSQLSERDRTVIRVTMTYWNAGSDHQRLPNDVAADLARSFDTSPENIRKIRERAMRKIRSHVERCMQSRTGDQS